MYEKYSLKSNPFVEQTQFYEMVDRRTIMNDLNTKLETSIKSKSSHFLFILGDYGLGKTFILYQIAEKLRNHTLLSEDLKKVVVAYVKATTPKPPSNYLHYLYSQIMEGIGIDTFKHLYKEISALAKVKSQSEAQFLRSHNLDSDFVEGFVGISEGYESEAWPFIIAKPFIQEHLNVDFEIKKDEQAMKMLFEFLKLLKIADYKNLIILIDEFEYIFTAAGSKRTAQIIVTYKDLFDKLNEINSENMAQLTAIFACTPDSYGEIPALAEQVGLGGIVPFWQRNLATYDLKPFTNEDTRNLIRTRLKSFRIEGSNVSELYPFTEDFIDYIIDFSRGNPRSILKNTSVVLEEAAKAGYDNIGVEEAKNVLEEDTLKDIV